MKRQKLESGDALELDGSFSDDHLDHSKSKITFNDVLPENPPLGFTPEQYAFITSDSMSNPALIAGAGQGKTYTIVHRVLYLLDQAHKIPRPAQQLEQRPDQKKQILVVTFTKNAAEELRTRIDAECTAAQRKMLRVGTFHGLAAELWADCVQPLASVDECLVYFLRAIVGNQLPEFQAVVVDECQDMNALQVEVVLEFAKRGAKVNLVGDPDQLLYAFRGSSVQLMNRLFTTLGCKVYYLGVNFRSSPEIIALANLCVLRNRSADLYEWQARKPEMVCGFPEISRMYMGQKTPLVLDFDSFDDELRFLVTDLQRLIKSKHPGDRQIELHDIAVIVRNNFLLYRAQAALMEKHCPCAVVSQASGKRMGHVQLLTIHGAKGLEFVAEYFIGVSSKGMPDARGTSPLEDERRLFYVALTRPRRFLTLCHSTFSPSLLVAELEPKIDFLARWVFVHANGRKGSFMTHMQPKGLEAGERAEVFLLAQYEENKIKNIKLPDVELSRFIQELHGPDFVRIKEDLLSPNWKNEILKQIDLSESQGFPWPGWAERDLKQELLDFFHLALSKMVSQLRAQSCTIRKVDEVFSSKRQRGIPAPFYAQREFAYKSVQKADVCWRALLTQMWAVTEILAVAAGRRVVMHTKIQHANLLELMPHLEKIETGIAKPLVALEQDFLKQNPEASIKERFEKPLGIRTPCLHTEVFARVGNTACIASPTSVFNQGESLMAEILRGHAVIALWKSIFGLREPRLTKVLLMDLLVPQCVSLDLTAWNTELSEDLLHMITNRRKSF